MGFIIPSDEVARLINAMETVLRYITGLYHDKFSIATKKDAQTYYKRLSSYKIFQLKVET